MVISEWFMFIGFVGIERENLSQTIEEVQVRNTMVERFGYGVDISEDKILDLSSHTLALASFKESFHFLLNLIIKF